MDYPTTTTTACSLSGSGVPGLSAAAVGLGPPLPQQLHSLPRVTISHIYRCMHYYTVHASLHRVRITKSEVGVRVATTRGVDLWSCPAILLLVLSVCSRSMLGDSIMRLALVRLVIPEI